MATLAEAVDAAETDWLVSADIPDTVDYLTVESEVVQVTATFPAQYQARDGSTSAPRIRVVRAAGGTTAASHADATALTPLIPPAAAGGGAAALSLDNTIDPPADITSLVAAGATVVGSEATLRGKDFYAQDTDPGAVGAGSVWKNTGVSPYVFWERNDADTGWVASFVANVVGILDENANSNTLATVLGVGNAYAGPGATAVDGEANAVPAASTTGGGNANAGPTANTSDTGAASAAPVAIASGDGDADTTAQAYATTGTATGGAIAARGAVEAGMRAVVDGTSGRMAFNGVTPIARPVIPATPTEQDIADVLVALGLATQTP